MNRLAELFHKKKNILSIYLTAGFPNAEDTLRVVQALELTGKVDMLEIGFPFSDPIADGETIQQSCQTAIRNGMTIKRLLDDMKHLRSITDMPVLLMGYLNPVMQFGLERFCEEAKHASIDGVIIPDLPPNTQRTPFKHHFQKNNIKSVLLVTPQTSSERIKERAAETEGFLYIVSSSSVTGTAMHSNEKTIHYLERIKNMHLNIPCLIGFGISDKASFDMACRYADGAIIGSAFIRALQKNNGATLEENIHNFVSTIK